MHMPYRRLRVMYTSYQSMVIARALVRSAIWVVPTRSTLSYIFVMDRTESIWARPRISRVFLAGFDKGHCRV